MGSAGRFVATLKNVRVHLPLGHRPNPLMLFRAMPLPSNDSYRPLTLNSEGPLGGSGNFAIEAREMGGKGEGATVTYTSSHEVPLCVGAKPPPVGDPEA